MYIHLGKTVFITADIPHYEAIQYAGAAECALMCRGGGGGGRGAERESVNQS